MKWCINILVLLYLISYSKAGALAVHNENTSKISLDTTITDNTSLTPFNPEITISGLTICGEIILHTESSMVRIILMDNNYHEYLIYEIYPILAGCRELFLDNEGEETSYLDNIIPMKIIIEQIDATVHLNEINIPDNIQFQRNLKSNASHAQNSLKIDRINQHIRESGFKWVAGETSISKLTYQEKKRLFGGKLPNLQGFEYYKEGVFVMPGTSFDTENVLCKKSMDSDSVQSQYVSEFSWRNRHGEDWVTPVKDQGGCNSCWAFATTAATELLVNLYYNRHLDYNLSEQQLISCTYATCGGLGTYFTGLNQIQNTGIVMEDCLPYGASDQDCSGICNNPEDRIMITDFASFEDVDEKKRAVIAGATASTVRGWGHLVQVVGFKTIEAGDSLFVKNSDVQSWITFQKNDPYIGRTAWLCKNSYGPGWGDSGYVYLVWREGSVVMHSLKGPVSSMNLDSTDILCVDRDNDGYYSWGVGPKPPHCPDCPDEPDGDDSDPSLGPMNEFGHMITIRPTSSVGDPSCINCQAIHDFNATGSNNKLFQNYPNPFNQSTRIKYRIDKAVLVLLKIYDPRGREIATLLNEKQEPGLHEVQWNAINEPGGVYFCKIQAGNFTNLRKMLLLR